MRNYKTSNDGFISEGYYVGKNGVHCDVIFDGFYDPPYDEKRIISTCKIGCDIASLTEDGNVYFMDELVSEDFIKDIIEARQINNRDPQVKV